MNQPKRKGSMASGLLNRDAALRESGPRLARPVTDGAEDAPVRLLHTSYHVTAEQHAAVAKVAAARLAEQRTRRMDNSAVLRDVIDWWQDNQASFELWLATRPRR